MRIAIPVSSGRLAQHFGHCESFVMMDVDETSRTVTRTETLGAPPHQPGLLPAWLAEHGANRILAGGMGSRAVDLLVAAGVQVTLGVSDGTPEELVSAWLDNTLQTGGNLCDH